MILIDWLSPEILFTLWLSTLSAVFFFFFFFCNIFLLIKDTKVKKNYINRRQKRNIQQFGGKITTYNNR